VTAFLVGYPPHSSRAYFSDLKAWWAWCAQTGLRCWRRCGSGRVPRALSLRRFQGIGRNTLNTLLARLVKDGEIDIRQLPTGRRGYALSDSGAKVPADPPRSAVRPIRRPPCVGSSSSSCASAPDRRCANNVVEAQRDELAAVTAF
jgi:hypothetical protein